MSNFSFTERGLSVALNGADERPFIESARGGFNAFGADFLFSSNAGETGRKNRSSIGGSTHTSANSHGDSLAGRKSRVRRACGRALYYFQVAVGVALMAALGAVVAWSFVTPIPPL